MKLYDWLSIDKGSYDCYDTDIDESVTIDWIDKPKSDYDFFVVGLLKKVDIEQKTDGCTLVCDWSKLIRENLSKFKAFTKEHWEHDYKDKYEFIYQWIRELHYYVAGCVSESFYSTLKEFVDSLN